MHDQTQIEQLLTGWEMFLKRHFETTEGRSLVDILMDPEAIKSRPELVRMIDDPRLLPLIQFPPNKLPVLSDAEYIELFEPISILWNYGIEVEDQVAIMRELLEHLESPDTILDVGCGLCPHLAFLQQEGVIKARAVGLDASAGILAKAKQVAKDEGVRVTLHQGWANALPFGDDDFEQVICIDMLNLSEAWQEVLVEMARVISDGGRIFICYPRFSLRRIISAHDVIGILSKNGIDIQRATIFQTSKAAEPDPATLRTFITGVKQKSKTTIIVPSITDHTS